ncbi:hypothetical protein [Micromonospora sp. KC606]|uniref:hypothetical protein n=1 Tax=Micromonospora sp. KC606 TaxID=2530379 RepID=UPI001A9E0026|nr:hypothetical protein [Micromonospora sp. KC606]
MTGAVRTITGPSRRARWAAHTAALLAVPSGLWRIGLALGFPLGYTEQGHRDMVGSTGWGPVYLIGLSLLTEAAAMLTLGLVQRWGEVVPRWIPLIGGRTVPPLVAVVPAWIGVAVLAVLWTPFLLWWVVPHDGMTAAGHTLVGFLYLPLVAWAPLLAAVTISYQRRRRLPVSHDTLHVTHAIGSAGLQSSPARNG